MAAAVPRVALILAALLLTAACLTTAPVYLCQGTTAADGTPFFVCAPYEETKK